MGLGPIMSLYQARFNRYLQARGFVKWEREPKVWSFVGDGESDEPESLGQLTLAARENLDNLLWVVNCNTTRPGKNVTCMALQQIVFSHVAKRPSLQARMAATMEHQLSPLETFSVGQVLGWTLEAAVRGSVRVLPEFITMARRGSANNRELRLRQRLLAEAEASEHKPG